MAGQPENLMDSNKAWMGRLAGILVFEAVYIAAVRWLFLRSWGFDVAAPADWSYLADTAAAVWEGRRSFYWPFMMALAVAIIIAPVGGKVAAAWGEGRDVLFLLAPVRFLGRTAARPVAWVFNLATAFLLSFVPVRVSGFFRQGAALRQNDTTPAATLRQTVSERGRETEPPGGGPHPPEGGPHPPEEGRPPPEGGPHPSRNNPLPPGSSPSPPSPGGPPPGDAGFYCEEDDDDSDEEDDEKDMAEEGEEAETRKPATEEPFNEPAEPAEPGPSFEQARANLFRWLIKRGWSVCPDFYVNADAGGGGFGGDIFDADPSAFVDIVAIQAFEIQLIYIVDLHGDTWTADPLTTETRGLPSWHAGGDSIPCPVATAIRARHRFLEHHAAVLEAVGPYHDDEIIATVILFNGGLANAGEAGWETGVVEVTAFAGEDPGPLAAVFGSPITSENVAAPALVAQLKSASAEARVFGLREKAA